VVSDDNKIEARSDYEAIAASKPFRHLLAIKKAFIIPAFLIFLVYYFALAVLVGYAPRFASTRVVGTVTVGYLFALSQFAVGWIIAVLYLLAATKFDALTADILGQYKLAPENLAQENLASENRAPEKLAQKKEDTGRH
jgi:uncharacterized membrane protein (DUF485 family)